jgi:ethylmalonyl-CoA/methylmalonyl-CoA decarboxylase
MSETPGEGAQPAAPDALAELTDWWRARGGGGAVRLTTDGPVARLTLDHPEAKNALSGAMLAQLADAVVALEGWRGEAVIVTGAGGTFCAGADLKQVRGALGDAEAAEKLNTLGSLLTARLRALPAVTVAAVEGWAVGGGAELAVACDLRVLAADARVGFVHGRLGLTPGWGGGGRLTRLLGRQRALRLLLEARPVGAQRALDLGLADRLAPPGEAVAAAEAVAAGWRGRAPEVIARIKAIVEAAHAGAPDEAAAVEADAFRSLWGGPAHRAALAASAKGR